jgi:hypothetical protein
MPVRGKWILSPLVLTDDRPLRTISRPNARILAQTNPRMGKTSLKVDRDKFEGLVKRLLHTEPVKREDVKISKKKPEKLIPPQK